MKKFRFLVKYGLLKRIKRRSFLVSNIIIFVLLAVIINIPAIISAVDNSDVNNLNVTIYNHTSESTLTADLDARLNADLDQDFFILSENDDSFNETLFWDTDDEDIVLYFTTENQILIYSKYPEYNQALSSQIELQLIDYQIDDYQSPVFTPVYAPDYEDPDQTALISSISSLLVLPVFLLITMATQFVGVDIIEEKSTKAIETIIASVPAKTHFLSKITAAMLFVIIQGVLIILYGVLSGLIFGGGTNTVSGLGDTANLLQYLGQILPNWQMLLILSLVFMIVGTLFYLIFSAMFASMAVTQEDYQQFQSPITMTLLIGFYIAIFSGLGGGSVILKIATFIPFFTPIVAPVAFASGALTINEALIALVVMIVFLVGSLYIVSPVYRVAILNYDQTKFWKRIKNYFKKAFHKNNNNKIRSDV